ncbi:hypothetical protein CHAB381_0079 [Campylobacter hominis ATCC BAA-381]|uniref:Uncharacterized protein n=1 Tax=Campylobacter hominis (strain ATCC BAA-381 / DSM 21671 / CCUG 45161 / LMG 19568 / NCTC 13146 / CH001A) TaxID=360107 RepID=A7HZK1_CAMHC|nr:hypothetical protein [Campylobacter hominis]ABS50993.1 hypothetical protein CHAB381_0079 [Campylobacter hominis ATCC BAA-381]UAK85445.1 hypothetical protein K8O82_06155 [Campylobacter hominis]
MYKIAFIIDIFQETVEYNINFNSEYNKKISKEIHDELFFIKRLKKFFSFFDEISNIKENPGKKYTLENNVKRKIQRII